jgi:hypothetical protein
MWFSNGGESKDTCVKMINELYLKDLKIGLFRRICG